jgi:predicted alpha/beta hydrolase family esterase
VPRQILFVQGGGADVHDGWDSKLVASLERELGKDYEVRYPRMPHEDDPRYASWKAALEKELAALDDDSFLVGHSVGGTILINALAERAPQRKIAGIFLIAAPFMGPGGWSSEDIKSSRDLGARLPKTTAIYLYHGSADDTAPCAHLDLYKQAIPQAHVRKLEGRDHQLGDDLSEVGADIKGMT